MTETKDLDLYGQDLAHSRLKEGYETGKEYAKQGDTRVVKALLFPVHVKTSSPMFAGVEVFQERLLRRGDKVTVQELGLIALEKGERLGAFYTDDELKEAGGNFTTEPVKVSSADLENEPVALSELGAHELVLWLTGDGDRKAPAVPEILEAVGSDKDLAKRLIEAEKTRDKDDPRKSLLAGLTKVAETE